MLLTAKGTQRIYRIHHVVPNYYKVFFEDVASQ
jgi:hypothetical protein